MDLRGGEHVLEEEQTMSTNGRPLIASIGASAGGVKALEAFFGGLRPRAASPSSW
jgi:chemotaxis response regulator CheB